MPKILYLSAILIFIAFFGMLVSSAYASASNISLIPTKSEPLGVFPKAIGIVLLIAGVVVVIAVLYYLMSRKHTIGQ
ncbi:MAG: hypothetical protein QXD11_00885 [Candidatus Micrarchaeaceae archaeon]